MCKPKKWGEEDSAPKNGGGSTMRRYDNDDDDHEKILRFLPRKKIGIVSENLQLFII